MENKSSFQFKNFKVLKSQIEITGESNNEDLSLDLTPQGHLNEKEGEFILVLKVSLKDSSESVNIKTKFQGLFTFENLDQNLESFIYTNAPAILFPYIRAYISTLTSISGTATITIPTLNLSGVKDELMKNTVKAN